MRFYDDRNAAVAICSAYLITGALACAVAIVMVALRVPASQYAIQHGRATGTFILPGELAGYLIVLVAGRLRRDGASIGNAGCGRSAGRRSRSG